MALTTTITESLTLNGSDCGSSAEYSHGSVQFYVKKVIEVPTTNGGISLYTCASSASGTDLDYDDVKYSRITK